MAMSSSGEYTVSLREHKERTRSHNDSHHSQIETFVHIHKSKTVCFNVRNSVLPQTDALSYVHTTGFPPAKGTCGEHPHLGKVRHIRFMSISSNI